MNTQEDLLGLLEDYTTSLDDRMDEKAAERVVELRRKIRMSDALEGKDKVPLRGLLDSQTHTFEIIKELKNSLSDTVKESRSAQFISKSMYILTFLLGFGMFAMSIYFAFEGKELFSMIFGGVGLATVITYFIANPPLKIQDSRSNYAQLNVAVLTWFNDFLEKSVLSVNNQKIILSLLAEPQEGQPPRTKAEVLELNRIMIENGMTIARDQIKNTNELLYLIENVAEPSSRRPRSSSVMDVDKGSAGLKE